MVLDSKFLLPNLSSKDYSRLNIAKSFKMRKKTDLNVPYRLQLNNKSNNNDRRIIIKILKMDKNYQYGHAMTKHCTKKLCFSLTI